MFWTVEKLKRAIPQIAAAAIRATQPIADVTTCITPGSVADNAMAPPPASDDAIWQPLRVGERWGAVPGTDPNEPPVMIDWGIPANGGSTHWLRTTFEVPAEWRGKPVLLHMQWTGEGQSSLEGIAYINGEALAGIDDFHRAVLLPEALHEGAHEVLIRTYVPFAQPFGGLSIQLRDETVFHLAHMLRAALGAVETYRDSDPERHTLLTRLNDTYNLLDLRAGYTSEQFAQSAAAALDSLKGGLTAGLASGQRPKLISTGHAHLDVAWLWPLWRTRQKVAHTVATALHLMERYPDYHFSMSQPQVYAYLKQDAPELFERMKQMVAQGRFEPVGMMWLEPDCNIPSGESLVRQLLHGFHFFAEEFPDKYGTPDALPHVVWLPDVFGYSAALPQLMRGVGIKCFMTTKISWNQFNRMPVDTFKWRGIDGSEVLTHFVTASDQPVKHPADAQFYTYVGKMTPQEAFGTWNHYRQKDVNDELLYIYGWGDGGGGPTEEMLEVANVLHDFPGYPQVELGRIDQFFERLYERVWNNPQLPTWSGELYLEYHRGTYTSQGRTKQANRAAELLYREAEWLNAWAHTLGAENRQDQLNAGWKITLLNQFHDILPGSSVPLVYVESNAQFATVLRVGAEVRDGAAEVVASQDRGQGTEDQGQNEGQNEGQGEGRKTEDEGQTAADLGTESSVLGPRSSVVFNSLPWDRTDYVRLPLGDGEQNTDGENESSPLTQVVEELNGDRVRLVEAEVPSYGYTILTSGASASPVSGLSSPVVSPDSITTDDFRITLDEHGEISSLYDVRNEREIVAPGTSINQLVAYEDRPMNWSAWDIDIFYEEKPYPVREITKRRVIEQGPIRAGIEITRKLGQSTIRQRIYVWRNSRRIDFETEVDWQERQTLLRALFPLNINARAATCEIQFGAVERPTHRNTSWDWARFEVCAHRWVDLSEGGYGVALLNTGKYGHSLLHNTIGISLLKSGIHPDPEADRGLHRFTYSLFPHAGDWREAQVTRRAYELNAPLRAISDKVTGWQGDKVTSDTDDRSVTLSPSHPVTLSFLSSPTDHIIVETVKVAEDGDGLIVRLYEAHNQRGPASITFGQAVASAVEVDLLERETGSVTVEGNEVRFNVRPFEVKTLRVRLA